MKNISVKYTILIFFLLLTVIVVVAFSGFVSYMKKGEQALNSITFTDIDISALPNGTYTGDFEAGPVYAKVTVTITSGSITEIKLLEHQNGKGWTAEHILETIIEKQTTDVEVISGATYSSKVIRKAVEVALTNK